MMADDNARSEVMDGTAVEDDECHFVLMVVELGTGKVDD